MIAESLPVNVRCICRWTFVTVTRCRDGHLSQDSTLTTSSNDCSVAVIASGSWRLLSRSRSRDHYYFWHLFNHSLFPQLIPGQCRIPAVLPKSHWRVCGCEKSTGNMEYVWSKSFLSHNEECHITGKNLNWLRGITLAVFKFLRQQKRVIVKNRELSEMTNEQSKTETVNHHSESYQRYSSSVIRMWYRNIMSCSSVNLTTTT